MHIFISVLAALITAYALRWWWESRHERRAMRRQRRALRRFYRQQEPRPWPAEALAWQPARADYVVVAAILAGIFVMVFVAIAMATR